MTEGNDAVAASRTSGSEAIPLIQPMSGDAIEKLATLSLGSNHLEAAANDSRVLLCDMGYGVPKEVRPRREKILAIARQLVNFVEFQCAQAHPPTPVRILDCPDDAIEEALCSRMKELLKADIPDHVRFVRNTTLSEFVDAVYLSPDAPDVLSFDTAPPSQLVVGLLIDRRVQVDRSLQRAEKLGLRAARLPLDSFTNLSPNEPLNVDCVLEGIQRWQWNTEPGEDAFWKALRHHESRHPKRVQHIS